MQTTLHHPPWERIGGEVSSIQSVRLRGAFSWHHDERWHAKEDQQERQNRGNHQGSHGEVKVVEPGVIPS